MRKLMVLDKRGYCCVLGAPIVDRSRCGRANPAEGGLCGRSLQKELGAFSGVRKSLSARVEGSAAPFNAPLHPAGRSAIDSNRRSTCGLLFLAVDRRSALDRRFTIYLRSASDLELDRGLSTRLHIQPFISPLSLCYQLKKILPVFLLILNRPTNL